MPVVGDASVIVRAITDKVKSDIERAFKDARPAVQAAGRDHAKAYGDAFRTELTSSMNKTMSDTFGSREMNASASQAGRNHARAYGGTFARELGQLNMSRVAAQLTDNLHDEMVDGAEEAATDAGRVAEDAARRSFGNAGRGGGNAFSQALNSEFSRAAQAISRGFTTIYAAGNVLGPLIGSLVSVISAAVSGLYAMASAASVAAGSLAVLPGIVSAAAQGIGGLRLAFGGVGDALQAGLKDATASVGAAGTTAVNTANAVADAEKALARAQQDAGRARADAAERVADAERDVYDAQKNVLAIQKELTQARKDAAEQLQQLAFSAEDAGLAEQRAQLNLEDAFTQLQAVQSLPADDRSRREAELSYKEAELAYREAKDRSNDLAKEQKKATKAGIEGSDQVVEVRKKIADAQDSLADKERALADAREAQDRQRVDSAQALADAQENLTRAQAAQTAALAKGTTTANAYKIALDKLSPAAQTFVKYLISIRGEIKNLRAAAGEELFPRLQQALEPIITRVFPILQTQLHETGRLWGEAALGVSRALTNIEGLSRIRNIMSGNNALFRIFAQRGKDGQNAFDQLTTVVLRLLAAVQPLTLRFARWVRSLIGAADAATDSKKKMQGLRDFFDTAGDRAALLGDIIHNLWDIIVNLGKASDTAGVGLLESFNKATRSLAKFTGKASTQKRLNQYFEDAADNLRDIGDLLVVIGDEFLSLGDNRGAGKFATSLIPAVRNLGKMGDQLTDAGPQLGEFFTQITRIMTAFTDSGSIKIFLGILTRVARTLADIAESPVGKRILLIAGSIAAVTRSFSLLLILSTFIFKLLIGGPLRVIKMFTSLGGAGKRLGQSWKGLRDGSLSLKQAFANIGKGSDGTISAFERQMATDREKVLSLKAVEEQADRTAFALLRVKEAGAPGLGAGKAPVGAPIATSASRSLTPAAAAAAPAAVSVARTEQAAAQAVGPVGKLGGALGGLSTALLGISGPVVLVIGAIAALIGFLVLLYRHSPQFKKFVDNIVDKVKELGKWVSQIFEKYVFPALDRFFGWVNENLPKAGAIIGNVFNHVIIPYLKIFWKVWSTYFKLIFTVYKTVFLAIKSVVETVFIPLVQRILIPWLKVLWLAFSTYYKLIWTIVKTAFNLIKSYVMNILVPVYQNVVFPIIKLLWALAKKYFGLVFSYWKRVWSAVKLVVNNVTLPIIHAVIDVFQTLQDKVKLVVAKIAERWNWTKARLAELRAVFELAIARIKAVLDTLWSKVSDIFTRAWDKISGFLGKFLGFKDDIKNVVDDIKGFFASIGDGVAAAFEGLIGKVKEPLRDFLNFLNDNLVGNINKVTDNFGLTIPDIPVGFAEGGWTGPGPKRKVAGVVHADEHVIKAASRRRIERQFPGMLEHMNKTGTVPRGSSPGTGGWGALPDLGYKDIIGLGGDVIGGVKDVGEKIAKEGLGKVLEALVNAATSGMSAAGIKRGLFINDFFYAIMDKLAVAAKNWGGEEGQTPTRTLQQPQMAPTGGVPPYNGPSGGWTYPLTFRYPITQMPNLGHSPYWAVDIGAPDGTGVRAVSAGRITTAADIGDQSYGRYIKIAHNDGSWSLYAHLMKMLVGVGQIVKTGQLIGLSDTYGNAYGAHLHFELFDKLRNTYRAMLARGVRLAAGGVVNATPGGVLSLIGEAGRNERVEPLDNRGMSKRDQVILEEIRAALSQGGHGDTYKIYPSAGMNEAELARLVSRRVAWRRTVGT